MAESKFKLRTKRIPLSFLGEEWAEAYIETRYLSIADSRLVEEALKAVPDGDDLAAMEKALEIVRRQFVSGKTVGVDGDLVDFTADDLPVVIDDIKLIMPLYTRVLGEPDPKASPGSPTTTPAEPANQPGAESSDTAEHSA